MKSAAQGAVRVMFPNPTAFQHPLLQLMPYAPSAPKYLLAFQDEVHTVFDVNSSVDVRLERALQLHDRLERLHRLPDRTQLLAEVLKHAATDLPHPVVYEQLAHAQLAQDGIAIHHEGPGTPYLCWIRSSKDGLSVAPTSCSRSSAATVWKQVVDRLISSELYAFNALGLNDALASIRMLQLHILYGAVRTVSPTTEDRISFFEGPALSLWNALIESLQGRGAFTPELQDLYGRAAQMVIWHRLRGELNVEDLAKSTQPPKSRQALEGHIVILEPIPPANAAEDKEALRRYEVLQAPIPVQSLPSVAEIDNIQTRLLCEFPWAAHVVEELMAELRTRRLFGGMELGLTPTLLVGAPGCGKSRLSRRIAEELNVSTCALSFAGMSDSMALLGTSRGWSSGQASPLIDVLLRARSASAIIQLDEIDKSDTRSSNSIPPTVALLNLLEPENAKRWRDNFLQATCDLSKLMFIATANTLTPIPKPLLSRFRVFLFPSPKQEHFMAIAQGAIADLSTEWGLPKDALPTLHIRDLPALPMSAREIRELIRSHLARWAKDHLAIRH